MLAQLRISVVKIYKPASVQIQETPAHLKWANSITSSLEQCHVCVATGYFVLTK